jgi:LPS export ABC transporter protein LptC
MPLHRLRHGVLGAVLLLAGCDSNPQAGDAEAPPFVFRSLELRQKRADGQRDWDLISPEARYEFNRRLVRASRPEGILYRNDQPSFRISAERATVVNDGELVLLEGQVQLQQLQGQKVLIKGDRLRWTPSTSLLVMEQRPEAIDDLTHIKASKATLNQLSEDLTLLGTVQLERWSQPEAGIASAKRAETVVRSQKAAWNLGSGGLKAKGPILGQRFNQKRTVLQELKAQRLEGNTQQGFIDLIGPVNVVAPQSEGRLEASTTRWLFSDDTLVSASPFRASMKTSDLVGDGFRINMDKSTVSVPSGCRFSQPGEELRANQCRWNWMSNRVSAQGGVELKRASNQQVTRSERLEGTVGDQGTVTFSSPGGFVQSELTIKDASGSDQERRRPSSPVSF